MKIATWNVNSIRTRQQQVLEWLEKNSIDVLCLQETKVIDDDFPRKPFEDLGYFLYISGQKAYNGVAIFSLQPLEDVTSGFSPIIADNFDEQKRVITGVINNIRIVNLYVPNGSAVGSDKYNYKLSWLKVLKAYLEALIKTETTNICLCGDFNIALENRDIYNPEGKENQIMASDLEREALQEILSLGFEDAFRKFTPESGHFSWWDYRTKAFNNNRGWRIDHIYLNPELSQKASNCYIDINPRKLEKPSDHAPVVIVFNKSDI